MAKTYSTGRKTHSERVYLNMVFLLLLEAQNGNVTETARTINSAKWGLLWHKTLHFICVKSISIEAKYNKQSKSYDVIVENHNVPYTEPPEVVEELKNVEILRVDKDGLRIINNYWEMTKKVRFDGKTSRWKLL